VIVQHRMVKGIIEDALKKFGAGVSAVGKIFVYDLAERRILASRNRRDAL
jgi:hypothetical protein